MTNAHILIRCRNISLRHCIRRVLNCLRLKLLRVQSEVKGEKSEKSNNEDVEAVLKLSTVSKCQNAPIEVVVLKK